MSYPVLQTLLHAYGPQITAFRPFWALVGIRTIDILCGVAGAVADKKLDAKLIKKGPLELFITLMAIAACVCLHAVSAQLDPVVMIIVVGMGASDAVSIVGNIAGIYRSIGEPAPPWIDQASKFLAGISSEGVNAEIKANKTTSP